MKKETLVYITYSVIFMVGTILALIFSAEKNALFWISYGFVVVGLLVSCAVSVQFVNGNKKDFPTQFSLLFIVNLYWVISLAASVIMGFAAVRPLYATGIHVLLIGAFSVLYVALLIGKNHITVVESVRETKRRDLKTQISDLEQCQNVIRQRMPDISPDISAAFDTLIDKVRFSYPVTVDAAKELDTQISNSIAELKSIVESAVKTEGLAPIIKSKIEELLLMVENRNVRIRHLQK